jgi:hypothetical protein
MAHRFDTPRGLTPNFTCCGTGPDKIVLLREIAFLSGSGSLRTVLLDIPSLRFLKPFSGSVIMSP